MVSQFGQAVKHEVYGQLVWPGSKASSASLAKYSQSS